MKPYRHQQKEEKDRERETGGKKAPIGEIRMILGGLIIGGSFKSLKKAYAGEVKSIHSRFPPSKMPRSSQISSFLKEIPAVSDNPMTIC